MFSFLSFSMFYTLSLASRLRIMTSHDFIHARRHFIKGRPTPILSLRFAGMGATLLFGTMGDTLGRAWRGGGSGNGSGKGGVYDNIITEANAERLANALCR